MSLDDIQNPTYGNTAEQLLTAVVEISKQKKIRLVARETAKQLTQLSNAELCIVSKWNQFENKILYWSSFSKHAGTSSANSFLSYSLDNYPKLASVLIDHKTIQVDIQDKDIDEEDKLLLEGLSASRLLMFPIFAQDNVIGFIEIFHNSKEEISLEKLRGFHLIANHAGATLESAIIFWQSRQHTAQLEAVRKASLSLTSSLAIKEVFESILENSLSLSPDAMDSHLFLYESEKLTFQAAKWANSNETKQMAEPRKDGLTYAVAKSGNVIAIPNISKNKKYFANTTWKGSIVGLPLKIGAKVIGVMNIAFQRPQPFNEEQLRVMGLISDQAAIAIENARLHNLVIKQSLTDLLTDLPNRRAFESKLDDEIKRAGRYKHPFILILLDLNGFKIINDNLGHQIGDKALKLFGQFLLTNIRDTDFVARIGGDEFAMIFPETDLEQAKFVVSQIKKDLKIFPYPWYKTHPQIEMSFAEGLACYPKEGEDADELIKIADQKSYLNKPNQDRYSSKNS